MVGISAIIMADKITNQEPFLILGLFWWQLGAVIILLSLGAMLFYAFWRMFN